ncbi:lipopolysaccharide biosynthesis protein [Puniceicoccaceae bacterium K14]|nr:lipopolysaccharide biosynthesis protein [Puniceicoccaceae bacterium K14]
MVLENFKKKLGNLDKLYSMFDAAMLSVSRLLVGVVIARTSGVDDFSQYILFTAISVIFTNLVSSRFITPLSNLAAGRSRDERRKVYHWARIRIRRTHLVALCLVLVAGIFVAEGAIAWLVLLGFGLASVLELERYRLRTQLQIGFEMKRGALADAAGIAIMGIIFAGGIVLFELPVLFFWWGSVVGSLVSIILMNPNSEKGSPNDSDELGEADSRSLESIGSTMLIGSVANSACSRVQPFALKTLGGSIAVASFGAAWTFVGPIRMLTAALGGMLRPRLALYHNRGDKKSFQSLARRVNALLGACGGAGVLFSAFFGTEAMIFVFGDSLKSAGILLPFALAYGTIDAMTSMQMIGLQVLGKKGAQAATRLRITTAVASVILLIPSCYYWGALGAYGSLLVAEAIYGVGAFVYLRLQSDK